MVAIQAEAEAICSSKRINGSQVKKNARAISDSVSKVHEVIHAILRRLRPSLLDTLGLEDSLRELVEQWHGHNVRISYELMLEDDIGGLSEAINITLYRIIQEALNNVSYHSWADHVLIRLIRTPDEIIFLIEDNGVGINMQSQGYGSGFGLMGMRERVIALDGNFELTSKPGNGVRIEGRIPLVKLAQ